MEQGPRGALVSDRQVTSVCVFTADDAKLVLVLYCSCSGGELFTECILEEKFNEADVRQLMAQILEGLVYLHEKNIVHLDLKV